MAFRITSDKTSTAQVGVPYNYQIATTGSQGVVGFSHSEGPNPLVNLTLNSSAQLVGTPAIAGNQIVSLQAQDTWVTFGGGPQGVNNAWSTVTIAIAPNLSGPQGLTGADGATGPQGPEGPS